MKYAGSKQALLYFNGSCQYGGNYTLVGNNFVNDPTRNNIVGALNWITTYEDTTCTQFPFYNFSQNLFCGYNKSTPPFATQGNSTFIPSAANNTMLPFFTGNCSSYLPYWSINTLSTGLVEYNKLNSTSTPVTTSISFGQPCSNRTFWNAVGAVAKKPTIFNNANSALTSPMPAWNDDAYLVYLKNGSRSEGEYMMSARYWRLEYLVLAECIAWNGTYIAQLESDLINLAQQRTWTYPSADTNLDNFNGTKYSVDLNCAAWAASFGNILFLFGDNLNQTTRDIVTTQLDIRVFQPTLQEINNLQSRTPHIANGNFWWMTGSSNWNASERKMYVYFECFCKRAYTSPILVCWSGVAVAALGSNMKNNTGLQIILQAASTYSSHYLDSFQSE